MMPLQQFVHWPRFRRARAVIAVLAVVAGPALAACGGGSSAPPRRAPTQPDVARVAAAMSDIVLQCQSVQAGLASRVDAGALRSDVDALLGVYRRVRPDAKLTIGPLHTTPRRELELARANLRGDGCSPADARRVATALAP
jgi:hypothetical protein